MKRLKELEHENSRLKRLYADLSLENAALKDVHRKKSLRPAERWEAVTHVVTQGGLPVQRACAAMGLGGRRTTGLSRTGLGAMRR